MTSKEDKRQALIAVYRTQTWKEKVKAMSDQQVVAVYLRFQKDNKLK